MIKCTVYITVIRVLKAKSCIIWIGNIHPWMSFNVCHKMAAHKLPTNCQLHFTNSYTTIVFYSNVKQEFTDGRVVRAGVSVTWTVLSWSGGHEFESGQVKLRVRSTSVLGHTWTKNINDTDHWASHSYFFLFNMWNDTLFSLKGLQQLSFIKLKCSSHIAYNCPWLEWLATGYTYCTQVSKP